MRRRGFLAALFMPVVGCRRRRVGHCEACDRPLHAASRAIAWTGGRQGTFCCPACAVAARDQRGQPVRFVQFSDYDGGSKLDPRQAWLVRNSDVHPCSHDHGVVTQTKRAAAVHYDRCSPSVLAFRSRQAAERFAAQHGGSIIQPGHLR
jgi:hypothetical protein